MAIRPRAAKRARWSFPDGSWILAAHPEDGTVGAGATIAASRDCWVVHLADGDRTVPRHRSGGPAARHRESDPQTRADEARSALALAGVDAGRILRLGGVEEEAIADAAGLARRLAEELVSSRPPRLISHAFEGGHPDHDAAALVARAACTLVRDRGIAAPDLWEMTAYHVEAGAIVAGRFRGATPWIEVALDPDARSLKREMVARHRSQPELLRAFPLDVERFRPAPAYDFLSPPAAGELLYERMGWGSSWAWRALAEVALGELGLAGMPWR